MSAAPPTAAPPTRIKKRIYLPLILLMLLLGVAVGFYVRGTWADTVEKNPASPEEGTVTQLFQKPNGNVVVRCAVIVDAPPQEVWAVVTGYDKHKDFLPYVSKVKAVKQADGRYLIDGIAHSRLWGDWPFQSLTKHVEAPERGEYAAVWSEEDVGEFLYDRGSWTLKPTDSARKQTLLVFSGQIELKRFPNFIVRNIIMDRLHTVLKAMRDETLRRKKA